MTDLSRLLDAGWEAYRSARLRDAERLYARAEELARADGDIGALVKALRWRGHCLEHLNEYDTALITLMEAVKIDSPEVDPADRYSAMISAVMASRHTQPLATIERLINEVERELNNWRRQEWRHKLVSEKAHLLLMRGDFETSKSLAWEALRLHDADKSDFKFLRMNHVSDIAHRCFRTGDKRGMIRTELEANNTEPVTDFCNALKALASFYSARLSAHNLPLPLAIADQAEDTVTIVPNSLPAIRVIALAGQYDRARRSLSRLSPDFSDSGIFDHGLINGDIALMETRSALQLPAIDDDVSGDGPLPSRIVASSSSRDLLNQAKALYETIGPAAIREDIRLDTNYYTQQLKLRQARVAAICGVIRN